MVITDQMLLTHQVCPDIKEAPRRKIGSMPVASRLFLTKPAPGHMALLPGTSLLLGQSEDGIPLLLDLYDPASGPILAAGDGGTGKTAFLKSLARVSDLQNSGDVQFGVLTPFPQEWSAMEALPNCLGIWPAYHSAARSFLSQMVSWADVLPATRQVVLIMFDGLDLFMNGGFHILQDLRWLLINGPERHIWPVVTLNSGRMKRPETWLDFFRTRILSQVKSQPMARLLCADPDIDLADIHSRGQFCLSSPVGRLNFWLPPVD
jgi:hypothetical protein